MNSYNVFIAKWSNSHGILGLISVGPGGRGQDRGIAVNQAGECYFTGTFNGIMSFRGITVTNAAQFASDTFAAKLSLVDQPASLSLSLDMLAGLTITGPVGRKVIVTYTDGLGPTTNWITLPNMILPTSPYRFVDWSSKGSEKRFYRANVDY